MTTDKAKVAEYLAKLGYNAINENNGVFIIVPVPMHVGQKNKVRRILQAIEYRGKWGWKLAKAE